MCKICAAIEFKLLNQYLNPDKNTNAKNTICPIPTYNF